MTTQALLIADMQNGYFEGASSLSRAPMRQRLNRLKHSRHWAAQAIQ